MDSYPLYHQGSLESTTLMGVRHTAQEEPGLKNGRDVKRDFYIRYESIFFPTVRSNLKGNIFSSIQLAKTVKSNSI